jgi:hypothetical protein
MKNEKYKKGFQIFPGSGERFDNYVTAYVKDLVLSHAKIISHPTFKKISEALNIGRQRFRRLLEVLEILDEIRKLKGKK